MSNPANKSLIAIDRIGATPVYLQIYERFREAIAQGLLQPGDRVPSLRNLSAELRVARGTVEAAYEMLPGEGYFLARGQAGTPYRDEGFLAAEPGGDTVLAGERA